MKKCDEKARIERDLMMLDIEIDTTDRDI